MSDLISRDAAMKAIADRFDHPLWERRAHDAISSIPAAPQHPAACSFAEVKAIVEEEADAQSNLACGRMADHIIHRLTRLSALKSNGGGHDVIAETEAGVIEALLEVTRCAFDAMDNSCDEGEGHILVPHDSFDALSAAMDKLDELPDDQPGYVMNETAKAGWALRRLRSATLKQSTGTGE